VTLFCGLIMNLSTLSAMFVVMSDLFWCLSRSRGVTSRTYVSRCFIPRYIYSCILYVLFIYIVLTTCFIVYHASSVIVSKFYTCIFFWRLSLDIYIVNNF